MPLEVRQLPANAIGYEAINRPTPVEMTGEGFIKLPEIVNQTLKAYPQLKTPLLEMAATNPTTFLHQVMVAQCFRELKDKYLDSLVLSNPADEIRRLKKYLDAYDIPVLLHDIGKWMIDRDVPKAVAIVNSKPSDEFIAINGSDKDHRPITLIQAHKIHPLAGALALRVMAGMTPNVPKLIYEKSSDAAISHHEHFYDDKFIDKDGRITNSYPRKKLRTESSYHRIFHLLIKLADTAVAMGQPRIYRNTGKPDHQVIKALEDIVNYFFNSLAETIPEDRKITVHNRLIVMTMDTLTKIKSKYPEPVCYDLQGFTDEKGEPLPQIYHQGFMLKTIAQSVWKNNEVRLSQMAAASVI